MEQPTIPLGASSLPAIGFGTFEIAEADVEAAVSAALQLGYRHIDTAEGYNNESGVRSGSCAGIPLLALSR